MFMDTIQQVLKRVQPTGSCGGASTLPFEIKDCYCLGAPLWLRLVWKHYGLQVIYTTTIPF